MFQELKVCSTCEYSKDVSHFYWNKRFEKYYYSCIECHRKNVKEYKTKKGADIMKWSKTEKGKTSINEARKRSYAKFPEKWDARAKLRYAVKMGRLSKPIVCDTCEENKVLQGHHEDYSKPLDVMWLCSKCHADRHTYLKANNIII